MRKLILTLILFIAYLAIGRGQDRYASVSGSGEGDGTSQADEWTLTQAVANATAGMTVYVRAGLYSDLTLTQNNNGTAINPIKFIGYKTTPGDLDPDAQQDFTLGTQTIKVLSSFVYGDSVSSLEMPLWQENRSGTVGTGTGLNINGNYVHLYNIQFKYYLTHLWVNGDNCVIKNIIGSEAGDFTPGSGAPAYAGNGIQARGNNCAYKNIYIEDAGAQGFTVQGTNSSYDAITVTSDENANNTDYYFLFQEGNNNTATNIYVRRIGNSEQDDSPHYGHGIVYKSAQECFNNNVTDYIIDNSKLEIQFPGVHDNTVTNGYIYRDPLITSSTIGLGIRLANGAYDCTIDNAYLKQCDIGFMDWDDGLAGDVLDSADGFKFNQIIIDTGAKAAVTFNYFGNSRFSSSADNNTFYNCTFYATDYWFERSRANSNTQFVNCIFSDITGDTFFTGGSSGYTIDDSYSSTNFYNNTFTTPTGANITTANPLFTDAINDDFSLQSGSTLKGQGIATPFLAAGNDLGAVQSAAASAPNNGKGGPKGKLIRTMN